MCGIVGYAGLTKKKILDNSLEALKYRGPDDKGSNYFDGVALGNTRLAIIDLSSNGHMPMLTKDSSLCITFNGEIYNFKDIKKILEKKYTFKTNTDTEVILFSYQEWGIECLEKLNGMFSFVIFDRKKNLLFGARDRLGQKPLKYYYDNDKFIFASEIKAILPLLDEKPKLDEIAIDNFLTYQYVPSPKTGFKNIYKLPPAHYFIYKNKTLKIKKYWALKFNKKLNLSEKEWEVLIYEELKKTVKSHLISDVEIGAFLSGGLDSSLIVALMSMESSKKINTFSIGFEEKLFDESKYAQIVSKLYKTNHVQLKVSSNDLVDQMSKLINIYDEPLADNSILPTLIVSKLASKKVKVALTGDGGDENFAGYDRYSFINLSTLLSKFPKISKQVLSSSIKSSLSLFPNKHLDRMDRFLSTLDDPFYKKYTHYNSFFTNTKKHSIYSDDFKKAVRNNDSYLSGLNFYDKNLDDLDNALNIDINSYLPDDLLYKTDSASMANSLELRSPFLDYLLMEKMALMPSKMKINLFNKKKVLKEIAYKNNLLPKDVIYRAKHGFTIPQNKWFKGILKDFVFNTITTSKMNDMIFDSIKLKKYLDVYYKTSINYDNNIFALLILAMWINKYH